jgi:hypothetical protein
MVSSPSFVYTRSTLDFVDATNLILIINHCLELRMTPENYHVEKCMHVVVIGSSTGRFQSMVVVSIGMGRLLPWVASSCST